MTDQTRPSEPVTTVNVGAVFDRFGDCYACGHLSVWHDYTSAEMDPPCACCTSEAKRRRATANGSSQS